MAVRTLAVVASLDWLVGMTMVAAGLRRDVMVPLVLAAAAVLVALQAPKLHRVRTAVRSAEPARRWTTAETALVREWSPRAARLMLREPRLLWSILLLIQGRRDNPPHTQTFDGYRDALSTWITLGAVAALELAVTPLLPLPSWLGTALLILGVWGLLLVVGLIAAFVVHPHLLELERLRLRIGFWEEVVVPCAAIDKVQIRLGFADRGVHLGSGVVSVCTGGTVNATILLKSAVPIRGHHVTVVRLWVDDPDTLRRVINTQSR